MTVLVVGDAGLDITIALDHRPAADEKVHATSERRHAGGVAANTAVGLARLGTPASLISAVGDDAFGDAVVREVAGAGVDVEEVRRVRGAATYYSVSLVDVAGEKGLVVVPAGRLYPVAEQLPPGLSAEVRWLHTVPYDLALAAAWTDLARAAGVPISIDLEPATLTEGQTALVAILREVDTVIVNRAAVEQLGRSERELAAWLDGLGVRHVLQSHGADGVSLWQAGQPVRSVTPPAIDVVDTTGAGDALAAGYIHARLGGARVGDAVAYGCIAGALACTALGAQAGLPTAGDVERLWRPAPSHV